MDKIDPFVIVLMREESHLSNKSEEWLEVGRTEEIKDNENPIFKTTIQVSYYFEKNQKIRFVLMDSDSTKKKDDE